MKKTIGAGITGKSNPPLTKGRRGGVRKTILVLLLAAAAGAGILFNYIPLPWREGIGEGGGTRKWSLSLFMGNNKAVVEKLNPGLSFEGLVTFAEGFLPQPAEGQLSREGKEIIYKGAPAEGAKDKVEIASSSFNGLRTPRNDEKGVALRNDTLPVAPGNDETGAVPGKDKANYEAVFKEDAVDIWFKRQDAAFGLGIKAIFWDTQSSPYQGEAGRGKKSLVNSQIRNNRVIYQAGKSALIYTPLENGVREDIVIGQPEDLARLPLLWELGLDSSTQAKMEPDGSIGIYGPEQFLWGDIQIGDEKSAKLIEEARKTRLKPNFYIRFLCQ